MSLLKKRAEIKANKPKFVRQNADHKKEIGSGYRRPRGYHSKLRLKMSPRGIIMPSQGWRSPKAVRGLNPDGLKEVIVHTVADLEKVNAKTDIAVIGSTVGRKSKIPLLQKIVADKLPVSIDAQATLDKLEKDFKEQKDSRSKTIDKRKAQEEAAKAAEKKSEKPAKAAKAPSKDAKKDSDKSDAEAKVKEEKKEKDKILTSKETAM